MTVAFLFPGQGSQKVGMGKELFDRFQTAKTIFTQADQFLGIKLSELMFNGPKDILNETINAQPSLFVHSIASLQVLSDIRPDISPNYVAGHSLGELSALVCSFSISFEDGLNLVRKRGKFMKLAGEINPGGMTAILGLSIQEVEKICEDASDEESSVQLANDNCPGQVVISGAFNALTKAEEIARHKARRVVRLAVSIPSHSYLMEPAQSRFKKEIEKIQISIPKIPIIGNVSSRPLETVDQIKTDLVKQLTSPVKWTQSIEFIIKHGVNNFIEIGSGTVLSGLLKRIDNSVQITSFGSPLDVERLSSIPTS